MKEHTSYKTKMHLHTEISVVITSVNLQSADWHSLLLIDLSSPLNLFIFHKLWVHITYKFQMELS